MKHFGWLEVFNWRTHLRIELNEFDLNFTGIEPPTDKKIWIERRVPLTEEEKNVPIDRPFQYSGK